jgi:hypothetical protein
MRYWRNSMKKMKRKTRTKRKKSYLAGRSMMRKKRTRNSKTASRKTTWSLLLISKTARSPHRQRLR